MSSDNGIYILQSLDGYRVAHTQAIDNINWWKIWTCCNNPIPVCIDGQEKCQHCGKYLPDYERRDEINPEALKDYFGKSKIFNTEEEALKEAKRLYEEILDDDYGIIEYGINFIRGWEDKFFPEKL